MILIQNCAFDKCVYDDHMNDALMFLYPIFRTDILGVICLRMPVMFYLYFIGFRIFYTVYCLSHK